MIATQLVISRGRAAFQSRVLDLNPTFGACGLKHAKIRVRRQRGHEWPLFHRSVIFLMADG
jgi:hypothetical protein